MALPAPAGSYAEPTIVDMPDVAAATGQEIARRGEKAVARRKAADPAVAKRAGGRQVEKVAKPAKDKKRKKAKKAGNDDLAAKRKHDLQKRSLPKDDPDAFYTLDWGTTWRRFVLDWLGPTIFMVIASVLTFVAYVIAENLGLDAPTVLKAMGLATSGVAAGALARAKLKKNRENNEKSGENETAEKKSPDDKN